MGHGAKPSDLDALRGREDCTNDAVVSQSRVAHRGQLAEEGLLHEEGETRCRGAVWVGCWMLDSRGCGCGDIARVMCNACIIISLDRSTRINARDTRYAVGSMIQCTISGTTADFS